MNLLSVSALGGAALGILIGTAPAPAARVLSRPGAIPLRTSSRLPTRSAPRRRQNGMAVGCSTNAGPDANHAIFDGMSEKTGNVEGNLDSGVLAGANNLVCDGTSAIGAGESNDIGSNGGAILSFIGAGSSNAMTGTSSFIGAGADNEVTSTDGFAGAGIGNLTSGVYAFVGGGAANEAEGTGSFIGGGGAANFGQHSQGGSYGNIATTEDSFIGAGDLNGVYGPGSFIGAGGYADAANGGTQIGNEIQGTDSFLGAGSENAVGGSEAFEGAGFANYVEANGAFIGAGNYNKIADSANYAAISAGVRNTASGEYALVLGGFGNSASGEYSVVAGGDGNLASGTLSFSGGYHADAVHNGSFVWSDYSSGSAVVKDTAVNQFVARASGGVYLYSNEASTAGVKLAAGSGTWASLSDRNAKTAVVPLDDQVILAKVTTLPLSAWQYKTERGVRHVGPMAQDFYAAFGVGEDDRHITSIDEDGVALAAVKALGMENRQLRRDNGFLRSSFERAESAQQRNDRQKDTQIETLAASVRKLQTAVSHLESEEGR